MSEGQLYGSTTAVTPRPGQPEPFIRGAAYPAFGDVPYPRANPTDTSRLPADIWHAATVPVGVRLEVVGDAEGIDIAYRTATGNLGYRGDGAGITFSVWRGGRKVCEEDAVLGEGMIRLSLGSGAPDRPATIYLPEGMQPVILSLTAVKGEISPAPELPRWIAYGDWTTQGWTASGPSHGWAAIAARKAGLDLVNLGYAGAGRGEIVSAEHIAALQAAVITLAYGASCWTRIPHSAAMVAEGFHGFLDVVRQGHPSTPIVVISPVIRPDAEDIPNKLGASMADIRHAIESAARARIVDGDTTLTLVAGESMITQEHLADGIHPGDEGHKRIAATVAKALGTAMKATGETPGIDALRDEAHRLDAQTRPLETTSEYGMGSGGMSGVGSGTDVDAGVEMRTVEPRVSTSSPGTDLAGSELDGRSDIELDLESDAGSWAPETTVGPPGRPADPVMTEFEHRADDGDLRASDFGEGTTRVDEPTDDDLETLGDLDEFDEQVDEMDAASSSY